MAFEKMEELGTETLCLPIKHKHGTTRITEDRAQWQMYCLRSVIAGTGLTCTLTSLYRSNPWNTHTLLMLIISLKIHFGQH